MPRLSVPIVVVDDHQAIVLGLRTLFRAHPDIDVVAWAHTADDALAACRAHRPAVAVVDVALDGSDLDGVALCRRIRADVPGLGVVFYTGVDDRRLTERAFAAGALGVVCKGDSSGDLMRAVMLASRGKPYTSPGIAARAGGRDFPDLPPKQLAALRLLAEGLDRKQIAEHMGVGEETVKTHLSAVRRRLGARTSAHAVALGLVHALFDLSA